MKTIIALAAAALAIVPAAASAQVSLENKVLTEVVTRTPDGRAVKTMRPVSKLSPSATVVYAMTYRNNGGKPASNIVIDNPVPAAVVYAGSDTATQPQVSIDRGKTYAPLNSLTVRGPNGPRAAQYSDVTNVRFAIPGPVAAGTSGTVTYKGVVR